MAQIISNIDNLTEEFDQENQPFALFLDYDISYLSDPYNKVAMQDDLEFLEVLKHDRAYKIYLPITSNYNFVLHSQDPKIQKLINTKKIEFISVGLTTASDNISRRYYSYEMYKDEHQNSKEYPYVGIKLFHNIDEKNISKEFSQSGISLIENRIIFKDMYMIEDKEYSAWQSNWSKLSVMSANYPLDTIYEDDLRNAVLMVGAAHSQSNDNFEIDAFSRQISGIEMHANALMSLYYLNGKLKRLPLFYSILIIFIVVAMVEFLIISFRESKFYNTLERKKQNYTNEFLKDIYTLLIPNDKEDFGELWLVVFSIAILFGISYYLLTHGEHYWFNWMIPAMLSVPYLLFMSFKKMVKK